ncbi:hypothetical protein Sden_1694 [Shewanella denitrificans OS217]|jgi:hypothetical protein|uniref:Uncharacterized protein n=1 Tax=Shewanella denitrificans (strain OS217 / ATCC BAA-1090 / DSM 15013) TaxID=318161 RepID=Q12NJ8_SHEDO|nr:hypothetical protein [Shewanella denitrificans]ABE54978.1 hypothetical protein Sden_1694 [Shewanella denitrificans OS217]
MTDADIEQQLDALFTSAPFDLHRFITLQKTISQHKNGDISPHYISAGLEVEFADYAKRLGYVLDSHLVVAESQDKINGISFKLVTDKGKLEASLPPFVVALKEADYLDVQKRVMILTHAMEEQLRGIFPRVGGNTYGVKMLSEVLTQITSDFGLTLVLKHSSVLQGDDAIQIYRNGSVDRNRSDADINLSMDIIQVNALLAADNTKASSKDDLFLTVREHMKDVLKKDTKIPEQYKPLLSHYLSQIPLMALQNIMHEVRKRNPAMTRDDFVTLGEVRSIQGFRLRSNGFLLDPVLSGTKDALGVWIKAGLNDFIKQDDELANIVAGLQLVLNNQTTALGKYLKQQWDFFFTGLSAVDSSLQLDRFWQMQTEILAKLKDASTQAAQMNIGPQERFPALMVETSSFMDYTKAPFMLRPDTHVPLSNGFLVEIRQLNDKMENNFLQGFNLPLYRNDRSRWESKRNTPEVASLRQQYMSAVSNTQASQQGASVTNPPAPRQAFGDSRQSQVKKKHKRCCIQ